MKVSYDAQVDAAFIRLSNEEPAGAVELQNGIILHVTENDKLVAIEILDVSQKFDVEELFKFEIDGLVLN